MSTKGGPRSTPSTITIELGRTCVRHCSRRNNPQISQISQIWPLRLQRRPPLTKGNNMTNRVLDAEEAKRDPRSYAIIGAGMEVHKHLGPGFLESVYFEALERELTLRGIPFQREVALPIYYK